ncbi:MAG: SDR family NAD(P)-dependent oxidoreductase, partial [Clostridia bacterium]|nr:SDR family NAD(P)-dependent oxidoreductase [Clostridia bacterium]
MKRVLITGGSGGIGAAIVRAFASEGCQVVFTYNKNLSSAEALSNETGATALAVDMENT